MSPGITVRPCRSIWRVAAPAVRRTASFAPAATMRSPRMATACTIEKAASTVTILPL
jgi:hypothetical protein